MENVALNFTSCPKKVMANCSTSDQKLITSSMMNFAFPRKKVVEKK